MLFVAMHTEPSQFRLFLPGGRLRGLAHENVVGATHVQWVRHPGWVGAVVGASAPALVPCSWPRGARDRGHAAAQGPPPKQPQPSPRGLLAERGSASRS